MPEYVPRMADKAPDEPVAATQQSADDRPGRPARSRRALLFGALGVAIVLVVIVAALAVYHDHGSTGSTSDVLIPAATETAISGGQYSAINFVLADQGTINGTYSTEFAVDFYLMTPSDYQFLVDKARVGSYTWDLNASGYVQIAYLQLNIPPGPWVFAMVNPNATVATAVGWVSPLTLRS